MTILQVISSLNPSTGGPPVVVSRLAAALAQPSPDAPTVHVVSYGSAREQQKIEHFLSDVPSAERVHQHFIPPLTYPERIWPRSARSFLNELLDGRMPGSPKNGFDLIHVHGVWDWLIKVSTSAARRRGIPYVISPHHMLNSWSLAQRTWKKQFAMELGGYRRMLNNAALLHMLNEDERDLVGQLHLRSPMTVIPNGVFLEEFSSPPDPGSFRRMHPELGADPYVLFLGRLHFQKGLDYLAEAFARCLGSRPDLRLVVAGPDVGGGPAFEQRANELGVADRIHRVGPIFGPEKLAAFTDAACFCLPSRAEGFSMAILEAMASGLPVVISEACHFPEVATHGAGQVVPLESSAIATAILRVVDFPDIRQAMSKASRTLVADRYTWRRIAEQFLERYQHVVQDAPRHREHKSP